MNVSLGEGLGDIKFGMSIELIEQMLGTPDKVDRCADERPLYLYNKLATTIWFDENSRVHWIQSSHAELTLHSTKLIGQNSKAVLDELTLKLADTYSCDDYGSMESFSFDSAQLEVQVEYGKVSQICFGHLWKNDHSPMYAVP